MFKVFIHRVVWIRDFGLYCLVCFFVFFFFFFLDLALCFLSSRCIDSLSGIPLECMDDGDDSFGRMDGVR